MRRKLPRSGDERTITEFLWFPKTIDREWRWLERSSYKQVFIRLCWRDWEWVNK